MMTVMGYQLPDLISITTGPLRETLISEECDTKHAAVRWSIPNLKSHHPRVTVTEVGLTPNV